MKPMTPKRWLIVFHCLIVLGCILVLVGGFVDYGALRTVLILLGFGLAVAAPIVSLFKCRCPSCDRHLRALGFSTDYCPYCGEFVD